ncbi:Ig-like domain-containing protein [Pseudobutyrivibrio sp.]
MRKQFLKLSALFLCLATAVGTGIALVHSNRKEPIKAEAANVLVAQATFNATNNNKSVSSYTASWTNTTNGFQWSLQNFNNNSNGWNYVKCGRKDNASVATIQTSNNVSDAISSVSITIDSLTSSKINSIKLYRGTSSFTNIGTFTKGTGVKTVNISSPTANQKYKIEFDCASGSSNGLLQLSNVSLFKTSSAVSPTSIACSAQTIDVASIVDLSSKVTFTPSGTTEKGLTYAIKSGSNYIDLNTTTGVVTGKKAGSAVVTITPTDTSAGATAIDVNITVNAIAAPGVSAGEQYTIYCIDSTNSTNTELTGVASNVGTATVFSGDTPSCSYLLDVEDGYFENTVAFKNGSNYLSLNSDGNNLHTTNTKNANASWIVTWNSSTNAATIENAAHRGRFIKNNYNKGAPRFACYLSSSTGLNAISLYPNQNAPITNFTIDSTASVVAGEHATIGVTYTPASTQDKALTWTSNNTSIVTVSSEGVIFGIAAGSTTVTASKVISDSTVTRTCTVTVTDPTSPFDFVPGSKGFGDSAKTTTASWVNEEKTSAAYYGGVAFEIHGTGNSGNFFTSNNSWRIYYNGGGGIQISVDPAEYEITSITITFTAAYDSTTHQTATLSDESGNTLTSGTAWTPSAGTWKQLFSVGVVANIQITRIVVATSVNQADPAVEINEVASVNYEDEGAFTALVFNASATPTWSSSDNTVLSVDASGNYSALKHGTVTVTATITVNNVAYSDHITVSVNGETLTIAEALAAAHEYDDTKTTYSEYTVIVEGYITNLNPDSKAAGEEHAFTLSDDKEGTSGANSIMLFGIYSNYTIRNYAVINGHVKVSGYICNYRGQYEITSPHTSEYSDDAMTYAKASYEALTSTCEASGPEGITFAQWNTLANNWSSVDSYSKAKLQAATSSYHYSEDIANWITRYTTIVEARSDLDDFMQLGITRKASNSIFALSSETSMSVMVMMCVVGGTGLAGYFFIRKRRLLGK